MKIDGTITRSVKKVDDSCIFKNERWSTFLDVHNKLVVHVSNVLLTMHVDEKEVDPDGVPVVYIDCQRVTRVRKMTDEEFEEAMKQYSGRIVLEFRTVNADERKEDGSET